MSKKIEDYWNLKPSRFRFLESLELSRRMGEHAAEPFTLTLTLSETPCESSERARFRFFGACGLKIGDLAGLKGLLFEIRDVSNEQMENINFRIFESENGAFDLFCYDFDFVVLD